MIQKKAITYKMNEPISYHTLNELYESVGWSGYTDFPDKMKKLLAGSAFYISAWHSNQLVGLIRAVGDNASILYVQDILVHPDYQRMGIGRHLMESLLDRHVHIRQIVLLTDDTEKTSAFYRSLKFQSTEETRSLAFVKMNLNN